MPKRDIVVIGASAGGVPALLKLVAGLPAGLPAAVFVVIHMRPGHDSQLPELLSQRGPLPAVHAIHGEAIVPGRIYVGPMDNHLMLRFGYMHVARGPKENGHRPSVDALFRTAARAYGPRVVAVVLTGHGDCGTAGLMSVRARGGVGVVQDPEEAMAPDMPRHALRLAAPEHVAPLEQIPALIARLVREAGPAGPQAIGTVSRDVMELEGDELGVRAEAVCPLCQGVLTRSEVNGHESYRCHVGHAFSLGSMAYEQAESVERALWSAVRALEESASLAHRLSGRSEIG
ncbi:MAG TPA: chemotaxis protein CheB, partial [Candidatus Binatia bacterium]|nr:chemotaxis protein CheB [Candidatus Binatia bacterium]